MDEFMTIKETSVKWSLENGVLILYVRKGEFQEYESLVNLGLFLQMLKSRKMNGLNLGNI